MGRPPRIQSETGNDMTDFTETPEFKAAVAKAVAEAMPSLMAAISTAKGGAPATSGDQSFAEGLALAIANISNQGIGKKTIVPPQVLKQREEARERMMNLLVEAHARGEVPSYTLTKKVYLNEVLIEPQAQDAATKALVDQHVYWPNVPNEFMIPADPLAKEIHTAFLESIAGGPASPAQKQSNFYVSGKVVIDGRKKAEMVSETHTVSPVPSFADPRMPPGAIKDIPVFGTIAAPVRVGVS